MTPEDKQILRELASRHASFANEDAALEALKEKSPKLYNKAVELRNFVKAKIDSLKPNAKAFVEEVNPLFRGEQNCLSLPYFFKNPQYSITQEKDLVKEKSSCEKFPG